MEPLLALLGLPPLPLELVGFDEGADAVALGVGFLFGFQTLLQVVFLFPAGFLVGLGGVVGGRRL